MVVKNKPHVPGVVALITARGGSKAIPRKNIKMLAGKPLIGWTIETALHSSMLDRVIVSTDDEEIAGIAKAFGAEVPFIRPASLAQDDSTHISVVLHALEYLRETTREIPDYLLLLQPTSPCRTLDDIEKCISLAKQSDADAVVSVCSAEKHPYLMKCIRDDGFLEDFAKSDIQYLRRQSLPKVYAINGAIYLNRCITLINEKTFFPKRTLPYVMPPYRSLDIDTEWDFFLADKILTKEFERHEI